METTDGKVGYPADEIGYRLHTAMRKYMDSKASAYAWNVVHLLDETWKAFCDAVAKAEARTADELIAVYETRDQWWPQQKTKESFYAQQIFSLALESFDEEDWEGMAGLLKEEYDV